MKLELPFGNTTVTLNIPGTHPVETIIPNETPITPDPETIIHKALQNPIGRKRLSKLVQPGDKVSIIVSDTTRPVPTALILPPLLNKLLAANVEKEDITIIFALGIHRSHTEEEKQNIVGRDIYQKYHCIDHNLKQCNHIGTTSRGTPVEVFEPVSRSDFVICTGNIEHHYFAGYTGGLKAVLPGVSSRRSIEANHARMIEQGTSPGNPDCPVRVDLEEAGKILGVDFILNVILNTNKQIVGAVAGHPVKAHRSGATMIDAMCKREIEPADIMIVSQGGWPKDINLFQSHKALEHVKAAVRPGGAIILVARCSEGLGDKIYEQWLDNTSGPQDAIKRLNHVFIQGGHKAALIGKLAEKFELYLVSDLLAETASKAYFKAESGVQEAFESTALQYGPQARVVVVPYGGSTLVVGNNKS
ncbi:MAG: nickel-dependent lactate racemase [Methanosarcinales archaeon]|nr:nickel-dependent lactate racemase [Methanosarcinales archaeon]